MSGPGQTAAAPRGAGPPPNVLAARYASVEMVEVWSPVARVVEERRLWITVLGTQAEHGLAVAPKVIDDYLGVIDEVDLDSIAAREARTRHDVKARIEELDALAGHELVHAGLTSRDVTDNVDQALVLRALAVIRRRALALLERLADRAEVDAERAVAGRTHNVVAQVTTMGKRWATIGEELLLAVEHLDDLVERYPARGAKGAIGTRQDLIDLVGADGADAVDEAVSDAVGTPHRLGSVGQIYPRSLDLAVVSALVRLSAGPANLAVLVRLMAGQELAAEEFRAGQVGSSAMPHKMNPHLSERISALRAVLDGHLAMAAALSGSTWNEGDVSCSVTRRVVLPDAFYAIDGLLGTAARVAEGVVCHDAMMDAELDRYLPFLVTGRMLSAAVAAGAAREDAHAVIKEHAVAAARELRAGGRGGPDLLAAVAADDRVPLDREAVGALASDPSAAWGDAPAQAEAFARRVRDLIAAAPPGAGPDVGRSPDL